MLQGGMDVVFTNIRPIWMVSQEARDVGSRWMSPTLGRKRLPGYMLVGTWEDLEATEKLRLLEGIVKLIRCSNDLYRRIS